MPLKHVSNRRAGRAAARQHSSTSERQPLNIEEILGVTVSCAFAAGSACFFWDDGSRVYKTGDWLFIIASLLNCSVAVHAAWRTAREIREKEETRQPADFERDEWQEIFAYVIANFVFAAGSVLFMPGLYPSLHAEERGQEVGAWLFILGSFGFVFASYWNALGLEDKQLDEALHDRVMHRVAHTELLLALFGSVLFVVGSFMFRPSLGTDCKHSVFSAAQASSMRWPISRRLRGTSGWQGGWHLLANELEFRSPLCDNTKWEGTVCFFIGSCAFIVQTSLGLARVKHLFSREHEPQSKG